MPPKTAGTRAPLWSAVDAFVDPRSQTEFGRTSRPRQNLLDDDGADPIPGVFLGDRVGEATYPHAELAFSRWDVAKQCGEPDGRTLSVGSQRSENHGGFADLSRCDGLAVETQLPDRFETVVGHVRIPVNEKIGVVTFFHDVPDHSKLLEHSRRTNEEPERVLEFNRPQRTIHVVFLPSFIYGIFCAMVGPRG